VWGFATREGCRTFGDALPLLRTLSVTAALRVCHSPSGLPVLLRRPRFHRLVDLPLPLLPRGAEVVFELQAEPEFRRASQVARQAERGIGGDPPAAAHDVIEAGCRDPQCPGELIDAHTQRLQNILPYGLPRMGSWYQVSHNVTIKIVS